MSQELSKRNFDPVQLLNQAFSYLKHLRLMVICFAFAVLAGIVYFTFSTPIYQARSLVYFQSFGSAVKNREVAETSINHARLSRSLIDRLKSQSVQISAAQNLGLLGPQATYEDLVEVVPSVRVGIIDGRHLEVTVQAYDPDVVRSFCGALVEEFQAFQETSWKEFRDEALERYALQLRELEEKVSNNVDSLSKLERDRKFTEVTIEQQSLLQIPKDIVETREKLKRMDSVRETLNKYDSQSRESNNTLSILSLLSSFEKETTVDVGNVIRRTSISGVRNSVGATAPEFQVVQPGNVEGLEPWRDLEKEKRIVENEIDEASETFLPDHPRMKELTAKLEATNRALKTEMLVLREKFDLEYERLTEKLAQLQERIPEYQKITEALGRSSLDYKTMEQSQEIWDTARKELSEKLSAISFAEDFDWVQLRFKGHTSLRDTNPISPNKKKLVIFSFLLGLGAALGIPTVLNLMDTTASTVTQLEELLALKGLGIVPLSDVDFLETVHRSPAQGSTIPNYLLECFRVIRANIGLNAAVSNEISSQVILITSARPQEGKSTQAANLAWAFHSIGEKVLIVDCDLRRGRVHDLLKLDNQEGTSRMLIGKVSPEDAIVHTEQPNFDAVPRGPIIPGSTELLCQDWFNNQIQKWRKSYDRIILDCPPVLGLSESSSLQRLADGVVMVIRSEKTSSKDVRDAVSLLRKIGAHFYGFVLNGVDLSKVGNYYQYYYYSAPYYDQFSEGVEADTCIPAGKRGRRMIKPASLSASKEEIAHPLHDDEVEDSFLEKLDSDKGTSGSSSEKEALSSIDEQDPWDDSSEETSWFQPTKSQSR